MKERVPVMRAAAAILFLMSGLTAGAETADTIFINGNIYTVNEKQPHAEAIAVNGSLAAVGSRPSGNRRSFLPGLISTKSRRTTLFSSLALMVTPGSQILLR